MADEEEEKDILTAEERAEMKILAGYMKTIIYYYQQLEAKLKDQNDILEKIESKFKDQNETLSRLKGELEELTRK